MMMLLYPKSKETGKALAFVIAVAKASGRKVLKLVWEREGGVTQRSFRPYVAGSGCDGTTNDNIHIRFIGVKLVGQLGDLARKFCFPCVFQYNKT